MNKKLSTVTIGIPAYNEETNIGFLIGDLLNQNQTKYSIEKIIISSDGSTDKTTEIIRNLKNKRILLFDNKKRKGIAAGQNRIIRNTNSDALVLLDADIRIKDPKFLEKLIFPIVSGKADLVAPHVQEVTPQKFFEKIIFISTQIKNLAYEEFKKGDNVYTCHGQARAFSKRLYKKIRFPSSIGEDAYSYFYCLSGGFKYRYVKNVSILYKLPDNFKDHAKQSIRFFQSQKLISKKFNKNFVLSEYSIPNQFLISSVINYLIKEPIYTVFYLLIVVYLVLKSYFYKKIGNTWDLSLSSKSLGAKL